jgi:hypothetical protein
MKKHAKKLLVIFAEGALEKRLVQDAKHFGALGYTVWDVRGGSADSTRSGIWDNDQTIELKIVCSPEVADALAAHVMSEYAENYGVTLYFADVQVLREQKF